jgi:predicted ribonuclease YlaK
MDITFIIVFVVVNLLPANAKQCTLKAEDYPQTMVIKRLQKGDWELQMPDNSKKRYRVEALNITQINSENDHKTDMRQFFALKSAGDWQIIKKQTRQLNLKADGSVEEAPIHIEFGKNSFSLKQLGENAWFKSIEVAY